jgi:ATP-dependent DNA ligase
MEFYLKMRERGEEGAMLKTLGHIWSDERSKEILKLKNIATADLKVVGANEGTGILSGNLGALCLETECGKVTVNCSGFPLKLRSEIWANITGNPVNYVVVTPTGDETRTANPGDTTINISSIVEVKYNEVIDDKRTGKKSLFLPRFSQERFDKKVANTAVELA